MNTWKKTKGFYMGLDLELSCITARLMTVYLEIGQSDCTGPQGLNICNQQRSRNMKHAPSWPAANELSKQCVPCSDPVGSGMAAVGSPYLWYSSVATHTSKDVSQSEGKGRAR
jgi:hypothetical protein